MSTDKEIGKRVKEAIINSGLKQNRVSIKLGLAKSTMTSYVLGIRHIPDENLKKIAELTNTSFEWLKNGSETEDVTCVNLITTELNNSQPWVSEPLKVYLQQLLDTKQYALLGIVTSLIQRNEDLTAKVIELTKELQELQKTKDYKTSTHNA